MTMRAGRNGDQFGKRGRVSVTPPMQQPALAANQSVSPIKWIGGGLAAAALVALLVGGTGGGGGGLLGGILGGMLGRHLANRAATPPATPAAHAPTQAPQRAGQTTVQRGGFGSTGSSGSFSSGS